jgi:hypothetical protein
MTPSVAVRDSILRESTSAGVPRPGGAERDAMIGALY